MEEETRIAVIGIIVEDKKKVGEVNQLLHEYGEFIIGRMGLPYEKRGVNIISIVCPMKKGESILSVLSLMRPWIRSAPFRAN